MNPLERLEIQLKAKHLKQEAITYWNLAENPMATPLGREHYKAKAREKEAEVSTLIDKLGTA